MEQEKRVKKFKPARKGDKNQQEPEVKPVVGMNVLLEKFTKHCANRGLTEKTVKTYRDFGERFLRYVENELNIHDINAIDGDVVDLFIDYLNSRKVSKVYINSNIRNLKPFFKWLLEKDHIQSNPFAGIKLIKADKKRKIPLTKEQVQALLNQTDMTSYAGIRDYYIIKLLYGTGMRIDEVLSLKINDIDFSDEIIYIEKSKNREDSFLPIPKSLIKPFKKYLKTWLSNDEKNNYFFQNQYGHKLDKNTFYRNLKTYARKAGIDPKLVNCHIFRHTFAIDFLMAGGSTASLRRQLRQKDLKVVEEYLCWLPENVKNEHRRYNPLDRMEST